jgi:hypothetical protein
MCLPIHPQQFNSSEIRTVEVFWKNRCELVVFPLPEMHDSLPLSTKNRFLNDVDLSTPDIRMKALINEADDLIDEMKHLFSLEKSSKFYRLMKRSLNNIAQFLYAVCVLLNISQLMDSSDDR